MLFSLPFAPRYRRLVLGWHLFVLCLSRTTHRARLKSNPLSWGCGDGKSGRCLNTDQVLTWSYKDSGYTKRCAGSDKHKSFGLRLSQSSAGDSLNNVMLSCCLLTLTLRGQDGLGGGLGSPPSPLPPPPRQSPVPNSGSGSPSRHGGRPWCGTAACCGPRGFSRLHGLRHDRPTPCSPSRLQQRPSRDLPFAALTLTESPAPALPRAGTALPVALTPLRRHHCRLWSTRERFHYKGRREKINAVTALSLPFPPPARSLPRNTGYATIPGRGCAAEQCSFFSAPW